jgi:hypothetical protein
MKTQKILTTTKAVELITEFLEKNYDIDFNEKYSKYYYYIIYKFWTYSTHIKDIEYTNISNNVFRTWLNINYKTKRLVDIIKSDLLELGLLESDGSYYKFNNGNKIKSKAIGYKLTDIFFNNTDIKILDFIAPKKIKKELEILPAYKNHIKSLKSLKIDYIGCINFINEKVKEGNYEIKPKNGEIRILTEEIAKTWILHAFNIKNKYYYFSKGKKVDRVYSNLTNFPSKLKDFLFFNKGIKTGVKDIVNSQPLFINVMMFNDGIIDENFKSDCENGIFYEELMKITKQDRDTTKTLVYTYILFGKHNDNTPLMKAMKTLYPIVYQYIKDKKGNNDTSEVFNEDDNDYSIIYTGDGNKTFSHILQNTEAELIMNVTKKILHKNNQLGLTIHDAIFCEEIHYDKIVKELIAEFGKYNITPKIK